MKTFVKAPLAGASAAALIPAGSAIGTSEISDRAGAAFAGGRPGTPSATAAVKACEAATLTLDAPAIAEPSTGESTSSGRLNRLLNLVL